MSSSPCRRRVSRSTRRVIPALPTDAVMSGALPDPYNAIHSPTNNSLTPRNRSAISPQALPNKGQNDVVDYQQSAQAERTSPHLSALLRDEELALQLMQEELSGVSLDETTVPGQGPSSAEYAPFEFAPGDPSASKDCQICFESKHVNLFPHTSEASGCRCLSEACLMCLQEHIKVQMSSKEWKVGSITCPICNRSLTHQDIEEYADGETLSIHLSHSLNHTIDALPNFIRCSSCPSGQLHEDALSQPIVTCAACSTAFCFTHRIPLGTNPHEDMSCIEYDAYLADPQHFKSAFQREQDRARLATAESAAAARAQRRFENIMEFRRARAESEDRLRKERERDERQRARGRRERQDRETTAREHRDREGRERHVRDRERLEREEQAHRGERERQENARRQAGVQEARDRAERARIEEERYREEQAQTAGERALAAEAIQRRRMEELYSERTAAQITKTCPACLVRIEKNEGCMHMACRCGYNFCWECLGPWKDNGCEVCFGGGVVHCH